MRLDLQLQFERETLMMIEWILSWCQKQNPQFLTYYEEVREEKLQWDLRHHYYMLEVSYRLEAPEFFIEHIEWMKNVLLTRGFEVTDLIYILETMMDAPYEELPDAFQRYQEKMLPHCIYQLKRMADHHSRSI